MVDYSKLELYQIMAMIVYAETPTDKRKDLNQYILRIVAEILNDK